jgi:hypothetical protein
MPWWRISVKQIACNSSITDPGSLFCHQFVAGPDFVGGLEGWKRLDVTGTLKITCHPELETQQVRRGELSLTLLGHMLDTDNPTASNLQILEKLILQFADIGTLIRSCDQFGGRWLIIAVHGDDQYLFTDALGLRQVFYTDATVPGPVWLVSQAGLAKRLFDLDFDSDTKIFVDSPQFSSYPEYSWPAGGTPFAELHHLLPNHYLHLNSRVCRRHWPWREAEIVPFDKAIDQLSRRLENTMAAVINRFDDIVLGITAGLDSRLVLAAARKWCDQIGYVTVQQTGMPDNHQDIAVPHALLARLGLPHSVVRAGSATSPEFNSLFKENVFLAHDWYRPDAEALWNTYRRSRVAITGGGAEVGRCPYRAGPNYPEATPERLAAMDHKEGSAYARDRFAEWLDDIEDTHGVDILDLYSWENGHGNWLAMTQLEFDIAWREIITPYNCRSILTTMLGVDEALRMRPRFRLARALMRNMWPEVLREPINPDSIVRRSLGDYAKRAVKKSLAILGLSQARPRNK